MIAPKSYARLAWIDYRVFWVDMQFVSVRNIDQCLIQSAIKKMPKDLWVECVELTFDGANMGDPWAVYDFMFDNYLTHRAVLDAVSRANIAVSDICYSNQ
tara:strand:+ start:29749 stop:30048 length:300 start_codon:yes stop_codon:yes gene_type:complete